MLMSVLNVCIGKTRGNYIYYEYIAVVINCQWYISMQSVILLTYALSVWSA